MAGKERRVEIKDWLGRVAYEEGYRDEGALIWADAKNQQLREQHPNPRLLRKGWNIFIPEKNRKDETGVVDTVHKFVVPTPKALLRIRVIDMDGNPVAGADYRLLVGLDVFTGKTYAGAAKAPPAGQWEPGMLQHEINVLSEDGVLELTKTGDTYRFKFGHLQEIEPDDRRSDATERGVQARLNNLGFGSGKIDGVVGPLTRAATHAFQAHLAANKEKTGYDSGPVDGIPGPITRGALKRFHGNL